MRAVAWLVEAGTGPAPCSLIYRSEAAAGKFAEAYEPGHVSVTPLVDGRIAAELMKACAAALASYPGWQKMIEAAYNKAEGAQS